MFVFADGGTAPYVTEVHRAGLERLPAPLGMIICFLLLLFIVFLGLGGYFLATGMPWPRRWRITVFLLCTAISFSTSCYAGQHWMPKHHYSQRHPSAIAVAKHYGVAPLGDEAEYSDDAAKQWKDREGKLYRGCAVRTTTPDDTHYFHRLVCTPVSDSSTKVFGDGK